MIIEDTCKPLPSPTPTILFNYATFDYEKTPVPEVMDAFYYLMEKLAAHHFEAHTPSKRGLHFLCEAESVGWKHFNLEAERRGTEIYKIFPIRIGRFVVVRQPVIMSAMLALCKPFMPTKMRERMVLLGADVHRVLEYYAPEHVPPSLGGTLEHDDDAWLRDWIWSECETLCLRIELDNNNGGGGGGARDEAGNVIAAPSPKLGLQLNPAHWWRVAHVAPGALGERAGFKLDDFVTHVDGAPLQSAKQIGEAIKKKQSFEITIRRPSRDVFSNPI